MSEQNVLLACQKGSEAWKEAFNRGDAKGCAALYTLNSTMNAKPFGTFTGREAIEAFWQDIINQGFSNVAYADINWQQVSDSAYVLSSSWTMNKAYGVVHKEHWVLQSDGQAQMIFDEFEIQGER